MRGARRDEGGFVLVVVLWVLAMLTIVTIGFGRRAMLERRAAAYALDQTQAAMMARGAVQRGIVEVRNRVYVNRIDPRHQGGTHAGQEWAQEHDLLDEGGYFETDDSFENDTVAFRAVDLERRIDINAVPKEFLDNIEALSQSARRRIWARRTKSEHEDEPVSPFIAPEELRYLRSVSDGDWFGERGKTGVRDVVAVLGGARVNFNTALPEVLAFVPGLDRAAVDAIVRYRAGSDGELYTEDDQGFANHGELFDTLGVDGDSSQALSTYCTADSSYFKIRGLATRRAGKVRAACAAVFVLQGEIPVVLEWQEAPIGS